jgi:hypothetical protein
MNTSRSAEEGKVNQGKDGPFNDQEERRISDGLHTLVGDDHVLDILAR